MKIRFFPAINRKSFFTLAFLMLIILVIRILTLSINELSWDVFGYYIHLPALYIYKDYGLNDISWISKLMETYPLTGTLYQISTGPEGNPIFFFLMGMSFFYTPWFFIAHLIPLLFNYPEDRFSIPYQYILASGVIIYSFAGLYFLRKILLNFFNDNTTSIVMVIIVLGTNYLHFQTIKNLETANILFLMVAFITWNTIQWHKSYRTINIIYISIGIVLTALAKPSEVLVILIPVLWGVFDKKSLINKIQVIKKHYYQIFYAIAVGLIVALPQLLYWYTETGHLIYDSYKNPGVGLDLASPHILEVLFSFKKGWFIYTPIMIFSIFGFYNLYKKNKGVFTPILIYSAISIYILSSWTEWWYGASYSIRPMITIYPLLAITTGFFIEKIKSLKNKKFTSFIFTSAILILIALNLFQTWQLNNYIIDPYRMTRGYYFAVFGKTKVTEEDRKFLAPDLTFNENAKITDESLFTKRNFGYYNFEEPDVNLTQHYVEDSVKGNILRMDSTLLFSPEIRTAFIALTSKDYAWIRAGVDILIPSNYNHELPLLVLTFERKEGSYYYHSYPIDTTIYPKGTWGKIQVDLMTPNIRSKTDLFKIYVWNRSSAPIFIDNLKADVFEPR